MCIRDRVKEEGICTGIAYIPVLPFISDSFEELEKMVKVAKEYDANYVFIGSLTLFGKVKELYYKVIEKYFPELIPKYEQLYRSFSQPSKDYEQRLRLVARKLCRKHNIKHGII